MADWKSYKNQTPWTVTHGDKPQYNEGDHISDYSNPVWSMEQGTDVPVTPTHIPCGYWTKGPHVPPVTMSPETGTVITSIPYDLIMSCDEDGAIICYTVDGSIPNQSSIQYTGPIPTYGDEITYKAIAFKSGYKQSTITTWTYKLTLAPMAMSWSTTDNSNYTVLGDGFTARQKNTANASWIRGDTPIPVDKKVYFEITNVNSGGAFYHGRDSFGVAKGSSNISVQVGADIEGWGVEEGNYWGHSKHNGGGCEGGNPPGSGAVIRVAVDMPNGKVWLGMDDAWHWGYNPAGDSCQFSDPVSTANPLGSDLAGDIFLAVRQSRGYTGIVFFNIGQEDFTGSVPSGFLPGIGDLKIIRSKG